MKSKDWIARQDKDIYVQRAKIDGYVSRAAFKLIEIDKKFKLISNSNRILELGSSPGGWSQVIIELNKKSKVHAFDLLDMKYDHPNFKFYKDDFINFDYSKLPYKFDLILSDIAPNTTGHKSTDHLKISTIIEDIIVILNKISLSSSSFVFKIWKGSEEQKILKSLKKSYKKISYFKPQSSRKESSEIYIVAQQYKG
jgi:23S rRNA (uridine2552-2'-O)-methyltransferase